VESGRLRYLASGLLTAYCLLLTVTMDPIQLGLPHRQPFIFIDEVTAVEAGRSANATKCFSSQEPFLKGHFPGNAIIPGVLLTEALAQTAGIAIGSPGKTFLLTAIRAMKFLRPVRPEEPIDLFAECLGEMSGLAQCAVRATCKGEPVAEGQLVLALAKQDENR
jgi:3-hydroxyacyl-[acyl-carrier-protein] dehydratase